MENSMVFLKEFQDLSSEFSNQQHTASVGNVHLHVSFICPDVSPRLWASSNSNGWVYSRKEMRKTKAGPCQHCLKIMWSDFTVMKPDWNDWKWEKPMPRVANGQVSSLGDRWARFLWETNSLPRDHITIQPMPMHRIVRLFFSHMCLSDSVTIQSSAMFFLYLCPGQHLTGWNWHFLVVFCFPLLLVWKQGALQAHWVM